MSELGNLASRLLHLLIRDWFEESRSVSTRESLPCSHARCERADESKWHEDDQLNENDEEERTCWDS